MKSFKKILLSVLALVLVVVLTVAGTVAYLTDEDSTVNVMVLGEINIEQHEQDRYGKTFVQGQTLLPLVGSASVKDENGYVAASNYIDKIVTVENIGKNAAYVRTFVAIPVYSYAGYDNNNASLNVVHWNGYFQGCEAPKYPTATRIPGTNVDVPNNWSWGNSTDAPVWPGNGGDWNMFEATIQGQDYYVYVITHVTPVEAGATTAPNMMGLYLDSKVDYDHDTGVYTIGGKEIENFDGTVEVLVGTQAVQYDIGWGDAWTALNTAFGVPTATAGHPWVDGVEIPPVVESSEDLLSAIADGNDTVVLGAGNYETITLPDSVDGLTILGSNDAVVENLNLNAAKNVIIDGVTFNAAEATPVYSAKTNAETGYYASITGSTGTDVGNNNGAKGIVIRNCVFTGVPADANTYAPICFEEQGRPTSRATNITIENCVFECEAVNYIRINYAAVGTITVNGNTFGSASIGTKHNTMNFTGNAADLIITNNTFYNWNPEKNAIGTSRQGTNVIDIVITGNTFNNTLVGEGGVIELKSSYTAANSIVDISANVYEGGLSGETDETAPIVKP